MIRTMTCSFACIALSLLASPVQAQPYCDVQSMQTFAAPDPTSEDLFGFSIDSFDNLMIVGAPGDDVEGVDAGAAYLYSYSTFDDAWTLTETFRPGVITAGDKFGYSVAIADGVVVVGSPGDGLLGTDAGAAYVFEWKSVSGRYEWVYVNRLLPPYTSPYFAYGHEFGKSVDVSKSTSDAIIVGTPGADSDDPGSGIPTGWAQIYKNDGTNWVHDTDLVATNATARRYLGSAVAIDGDWAVVSGIRASTGTGVASFFWQVSGNWASSTELTSPALPLDDDFGFSLDLEGTRVVIGAPLAQDSGQERGAAYVFKYRNVYPVGYDWYYEDRFGPGENSTSFGYDVDLADTRIAVGSIGALVSGGQQRRDNAYTFLLTGGVWQGEARLESVINEQWEHNFQSITISTGNNSGDPHVLRGNVGEYFPGLVRDYALVDEDDDDALDECDNCLAIHNPGQEDGDNDGAGDACDNCPYDQNPGQEDVDVASAITVWRFDEGSGTTAIDSVGSNDGSIQGPTYLSGQVNTALDFDGVTDHVTHSLQVGTQGTLVHWLRPAQIRNMVAYYESNGTGGWHNGFSDGHSIREIHSAVHSTGKYLFYYQDGTTRISVSGGIPQADTWAHVAVTWDTEGDLVLYVDGEEVNRKPLSTLSFAGLSATVGRIGRVGNGYTSRHWDGMIDEVAISNRVLTGAEIMNIYTEGLSDGYGDACDNCPDDPNSNQADVDADGVGGVCDNCPDDSNSNQEDADGDGVGSVCDNCPGVWNPAQHDTGGADGVGDACDCFMEYALADVLPHPAGADPDESVVPTEYMFYHSVTGEWYAKQAGCISVEWKDSSGARIEFRSYGIVATAGNSPNVHHVRYFTDCWIRAAGSNYSVNLESPDWLTVHYYDSSAEEGNSITEADVAYNATTGDFTLTGNPPGCVPEEVLRGWLVLQWDNGKGGPLVGFEVVEFIQLGFLESVEAIVGRPLDPPPPPVDRCRVEFIENSAADGGDIAEIHTPEKLVYPIRPEGNAERFKVAWYDSDGLGNCWPRSIERYTTVWPIDPQISVVDSSATQPPDPPLVDLRIDTEGSDLCGGGIAYQAGFAPADPLPNASVNLETGSFVATRPGWAVLRLDIDPVELDTVCGDEVTFEVIRLYEHTAAEVYLGQEGALIGTQLADHSHDAGGTRYPFGYVHQGRPFAPGIYGDTDQIIPVNTLGGGSPLEVWWFETGNPNTPGIYWPHTVVNYDPSWAVPAGTIVIESKVGVEIHEEGASLYHEGTPAEELDQSVIGWNPNDEHASVEILGGVATVFAVRDDNPYDLSSGHPYVLIKYPEPGDTGLWRMTVYDVSCDEDDLDYQAKVGTAIDPLYPVNDGVAGCDETNIEDRGVWKARDGAYWAYEANSPTGQPSVAQINLWENWPGDGCQPWRSFGGPNPTPITYRPYWPDCWSDNPEGECVRLVRPGQTLERRGYCGSIEELHRGVGLRALSKRYWSGVEYSFEGSTPAVIRFEALPPHLYDGQILNLEPTPDRISYGLDPDTQTYLLKFRGIMSDRDFAHLRALQEFLPVGEQGGYITALEQLKDASRVQLGTPLTAEDYIDVEDDRWLAIGDPKVGGGWLTLAYNNDELCTGPVQLEVLRVECPPFPGRIRVIAPQCPFDERMTLVFSGDLGGEPESFVFQWQWRVGDEAWQNYLPGDETGVGMNTVVLDGRQALIDRQWRVRYRGFDGCPCDDDPNCVDDCCPSVGPLEEDWFSGLNSESIGTTQVSAWTDTKFSAGWVTRVVDGLNLFDDRVGEFHTNAVATYVSMIQQAGIRYEGPVALTCDPDNLNEMGLIEGYETVLRRLRQLTIDTDDPAPAPDGVNTQIMRAASKLVELYTLLGNEAYADALDPTIGINIDYEQPPAFDPHAAFCFEQQVESLLAEELVLLRGRSERWPLTTDIDGSVMATVYNRLPWNFTNGNGEVAYANNYDVTNPSEAMDLYPQGHGDAWGHYLTASKQFYDLLGHQKFNWEKGTQVVPVAGNDVEVGFKYEQQFARVAQAKARTGVDIVAATFRQYYKADPTLRDGYPDLNEERAWGLAGWGRRAGQATYLDWVMVNALLDDDDGDEDHANTIKKIDRTTVTELRSLPASFTEIQMFVTNADAGLNPLGLATNVVPFGLSPDLIEAGSTHFDQIFVRATAALSNAAVAFDYANDNSRRLKAIQDDSEEYEHLVAQNELDFKSRLIEIFGRPYLEDVGPGGTYESSDVPDVYHFDYVDSYGFLEDQASNGHVTITRSFTELEIDSDGTVDYVNRQVDFNVSVGGLGLIKPEGWASRPEPGEIQMARSELMQALGSFEAGLATYEAHVETVKAQSDVLEAMYDLQREELVVRRAELDEVITLQDEIVFSAGVALSFRGAARAARDLLTYWDVIAASAAGGPGGVIATLSAIAAVEALEMLAETPGIYQLMKQNDIQRVSYASNLELLGGQHILQATGQIAMLRSLLAELPAKRLNLYVLEEAVQQAKGRYRGAIGRGSRLLEQRTLFRQKAADDISEYRYRDMAFRMFRNDALQKYRAQFDLAARYVYLAARAYDYETNLLCSAEESGCTFLTDIVQQRSLGVVQGGPQLGGNGLAEQLAQMWHNFDFVLRERLGFNSPQPLERNFSLRWELFRISKLLDSEPLWREKLESFVVENLHDLPEFERYCLGAETFTSPAPGIVIPFSTTAQNGANYFGWPSRGDEVLPAGYFALKIHKYGMQFESYPGFPLNNQVNVYLVPVGADIVREPTSGRPREWHLLDQTLPVPSPINVGDLEAVGWLPWDQLSGGSSSLLRPRRIPDVAACAAEHPDNCDLSPKLTGRSMWNTRWLLIIPGESLLGDDPDEGIETFIHGTWGRGVADIKINLQGYGYAGEYP